MQEIYICASVQFSGYSWRVLDIHIPDKNAGRLTIELCKDAFLRAFEFFPKHFPDFIYKGFMCNTWILEPKFQKILPPESNIVLFQKLFHLIPIIGGEENMLDSVFPGVPADQINTIKNTSLQRLILDNKKHGIYFNNVGGYILNYFPSTPAGQTVQKDSIGT